MTREKRGLDSNENEEDHSNSKRHALSSVNVETFKADILQQLRSSLVPEILSELRRSLAPMIRTVVSEEVQRAVANLAPGLNVRCGSACYSLSPPHTGFDILWSSPKQIEGLNGRKLQLHFRSKLSLPIFTDGKVEGEQGHAVIVEMRDSNTGHIVTPGPESSAKLDVVVLEGDFNNEDEDSWTREQFETHVVKEREGKRPLLTGDLQVTLKEGVGTLGDLTFTDNSSWIPCKKFRLGLKVASGYCESLRIREAKTDAFTVKDRRGELYKKHYPPASYDEVWRLEEIGKNGSFHKRLNNDGIYTVEDFLRFVNKDSQRLRNILGGRMSNKRWRILVEHANTCELSGKLYVFYNDDTKNVGILFNNFYKLSGLIAGGQYDRADSLSNSQKVYVDALVKKAYDNWTQIIEYDNKGLLSFEQNKHTKEVSSSRQDCPSSFDQQSSPLSPSVPVPSSQPLVASGLIDSGYNDDSGTSYLMDPHDGSISPQNQLIDVLKFQNVDPPIEPSHLTLYSFESLTEQEIDELLESEDMQHLHPTISLVDHNPVSATEDMHLLDSPCLSFPSTIHSWEMEDHNPLLVTNHNRDEEDHNTFNLPTTNYSSDEEDHYHSSGNAVVGWLKIKAALRWGIFIRKKAAERRAQIVELDD